VERDVLTKSAPSFVRSARDANGERVCGACLLPIDESAEVGAIDNCTHVFHHECAQKWSQTENSCPQCKTRFFWLACYDEFGKRSSLARIESKDQEEQEEEAFDDISVCERCKQVGDESQLLLCDGMHGTCNATFHVACVGLDSVPRGSWFCPDCIERGFDVDAQGRRGNVKSDKAASAAPAAPRSSPPPVDSPKNEGDKGTAMEPCSGNVAPVSTPRGRLPSQLQLNALACVTPAVEVPVFQPVEAERQPAGLFATFAARRRARHRAAGGASESCFISLNPSYEDDFMANKKG